MNDLNGSFRDLLLPAPLHPYRIPFSSSHVIRSAGFSQERHLIAPLIQPSLSRALQDIAGCTNFGSTRWLSSQQRSRPTSSLSGCDIRPRIRWGVISFSSRRLSRCLFEILHSLSLSDFPCHYHSFTSHHPDVFRLQIDQPVVGVDSTRHLPLPAVLWRAP